MLIPCSRESLNKPHLQPMVISSFLVDPELQTLIGDQAVNARIRKRNGIIPHQQLMIFFSVVAFSVMQLL